MKSCWILINPDAKKNYLATPGNRYAALLSVDSRASLSQVIDELAKNLAFKVTYSWMSGQPNRNAVFIDSWLAKLPAPTKGTNWMYFELNFVGDVPKTIVSHIQHCLHLLIVKICGNADIAYVFEAQQVDDNFHPCGPGDPQAGTCPPLAPPCAACPPASIPWKPVLVGAVLGGAAVGAFAALR